MGCRFLKRFKDITTQFSVFVTISIMDIFLLVRQKTIIILYISVLGFKEWRIYTNILGGQAEAG